MSGETVKQESSQTGRHHAGFHASVRRILVRAPNWIGDAVMCEPALRGLRTRFPSASITLLAKPAVADLFQTDRSLDRVVVYEDHGIHAGLAGKWTLAQTLRRSQFGLAVLFQNAFEAALLSWLAGIPRRCGYATDGRTMLLTDPVARPDRQILPHQVVYYWNLLRALGITGPPPPPALFVTEGEEAALDARLLEMGIGASDVVIGINPGSTYGGAKRWLPERFAEVAQRLTWRFNEARTPTTAVVIFGAKGEEALGAEVAARLTGRVVMLSGATTIRELMAATKRCRLLLTNDTGPMHIAAAFGVPVVAVFGPTDWRTTSPYGQEQGLVRDPVDCSPCLLRECPIDHRCMTRVSVDRVYQTAVTQLERQSSTNTGRAMGSEPVPSDLVPAGEAGPLVGVTVFLDRDGTLNPDPGYVRSAEEFELFPGADEALRILHRAGARLIVLTNQSGIARGLFTIEDLNHIHDKLRRLLLASGVALDAVYFCPHHPDDGCRCRKPETGMIDQAMSQQEIDLSRSYLVGDHARDMQLAKRVGVKSICVTTGRKGAGASACCDAEGIRPDAVLSSLREAAEWILADATTSGRPSSVGERGNSIVHDEDPFTERGPQGRHQHSTD